MLVPGRHDMYAADPGDLADLLDDLRADAQPLLRDLAGRHAAQPAVHLVGNVQAWHARAHVVEGPQRAHRSHPGEDPATAVEAEVADLGHPAGEGGHVEDELRLHELGARGGLLRQARGTEAGRRCERVLDRADQPAGPGGERPAGQQAAFVTHRPGGPQELHAVQVEHRVGVRVITEFRVVAGHQQHVRDAHGGGGEQVGLERQPVAVAAGELHDRLDSRLGGQQAAGPARHPHVRTGVVGDVDGIHPAAQRFHLAAQRRGIRPPRRPDLRGHREPARGEAAAQPAHWHVPAVAPGAGVPGAGVPGAGVPGAAHRLSSSPRQ